MSILHTIKAQLYDNALTPNPNDYIARVKPERSLTVGELCASATTRGGADISAPAMEHAANLLFKEMAYKLCDGFSINTGWFSAAPGIRGVFSSPTEKFNPEKHTITFEFHQGALLRKELESVEVEILGIADASLSIAQVTDVKTGSVNDMLTPNRNLRISGVKIKIAGTYPNIGVWFTDTETQDRTRVDVSDIVNNKPSELIIVIPELAKGTYQMEIITQYSGGNGLLKEPRKALFDRTLTVQ